MGVNADVKQTVNLCKIDVSIGELWPFDFRAIRSDAKTVSQALCKSDLTFPETGHYTRNTAR